MAVLTKDNSTVDEKSGAVIFHGSPELVETVKLQQMVEKILVQNDLIIRQNEILMEKLNTLAFNLHVD